MKIIFIEPKPPEPHVYSKYKIPRLGCVLLATILRDAGYEVKVYVEEIKKLDWAEANSADVIAISTTTSTTNRGYMMADKFRKAGKTVIMGGSHVTFMQEEALEHCDYVVRNEGEKVIVDLMKGIEKGDVPESLPNLSYKKDGKVINNPISAYIEDLDSLPIPDYTLVEGWKNNNLVLSLETSRGCPFNCAFCSVILMFGRKYRFKSVERIVKEVKYYIETLKPRHIFFCDDNFTAKPERTKQVLRRFIEEGLQLDWSAQVRVEAGRDPELLELMRQTNCYAVYVGLESVNPKTLELYNKHQTVDQIKSAISSFRKHQIHIHGMFVFGSDADDLQTIFDTVTFARKTRVDSVQFLILTPLPGTPVFNNLTKEGRIFNHDWSYYDGHNIVYEPTLMTAYELQVETFRAMNKFYSYPSVLRYIIKFDRWYTLVRIYAKYMVYKGMKVKRAYSNQLKEIIVNRLHVWSQKVKELRAPIKIGIAPNSLDRKHQEFFLNFFKNLGMNVIISQEKDAGVLEADIEADRSRLFTVLQGQIKAVQRKADIIFVPVLKRADRNVSGFLKAEKQKLSSLDPRLLLCEIDIDGLYKACTEMGIALGKNLRAIRKAYTAACKHVKVIPAPTT